MLYSYIIAVQQKAKYCPRIAALTYSMIYIFNTLLEAVKVKAIATHLTRLTNNAFQKFRPDPTRPAGRPDPCPCLVYTVHSVHCCCCCYGYCQGCLHHYKRRGEL